MVPAIICFINSLIPGRIGWLGSSSIGFQCGMLILIDITHVHRNYFIDGGQFDMIAPVPLEQCWRICLNRLHGCIRKWTHDINTIKQCTTKLCACSWGNCFNKIMSIPCGIDYMYFTAVYIVNALASGKFVLNFRYVILKLILVIDRWGISYEIALIWMSLDFTDDQSTLVQVMAWCHQATSHYLSQCWPRSLSPYGVTRPRWVN